MSIGNPSRMKPSPPLEMFDNGNWNFRVPQLVFISNKNNGTGLLFESHNICSEKIK